MMVFIGESPHAYDFQSVKIIYDSNLSIVHADVVACGIKNPSFIAMGLKFPCNYPEKSIVLLDDTLSFKFYSDFETSGGGCMIAMSCRELMTVPK
jgi:hypothetical protein